MSQSKNREHISIPLEEVIYEITSGACECGVRFGQPYNMDCTECRKEYEESKKYFENL